MNVEIYTCDNCNPCIEAMEWMDDRGINYVRKGMVSTIDEYPTITIDGVEIVGWGEAARRALGGE